MTGEPRTMIDAFTDLRAACSALFDALVEALYIRRILDALAALLLRARKNGAKL